MPTVRTGPLSVSWERLGLAALGLGCIPSRAKHSRAWRRLSKVFTLPQASPMQPRVALSTHHPLPRDYCYMSLLLRFGP